MAAMATKKGRTESPAPTAAKNKGSQLSRTLPEPNAVLLKNGSGLVPPTEPVRGPTWPYPARPEGLRRRLLHLHGAFVVVFLFFGLVGQSLVHDVPEGKFEKKDGTFIDILDYDPVELGPYPKCHPHFSEYEEVPGSGVWKKIIKTPKGGPYPVGHPENPEWRKRADELMKKAVEDNKFTWKGLQPSFHLLALATLAVYLGSLATVWNYTDTITAEEAAALPEYLQGQKSEQVLRAEDAYLFPVLGSVALLSMFWILKYLGTDWVKMLITCWVVLLCTFGLGANFEWMIAVFQQKFPSVLFIVPYVDEVITAAWLVGACTGAAMSIVYLFFKHWLVNNLFGVSFCVLAMRMITLPTYKVGLIMFIGLFFYDIFWVFGSKSVFGANVMVSVATGIEAPIKLMFPRALSGCGTLVTSMLGLGDIVVPGLFVSFLAKWDAHRMTDKKSKSFVYLNSVMIAYMLSLATTVSIMLFFNHAQPALLYIVPYVLITSFVVAVCRGELKELWAFQIADNEPAAPQTKSEEQKGAPASNEKKAQ